MAYYKLTNSSGVFIGVSTRYYLNSPFHYQEITLDEFQSLAAPTGMFAHDNPEAVESRKNEKIAESKTLLAAFLEEHPIISSCHGSIEASYTITEEKQNQFIRKFTSHTIKIQAGIPDTMTWNAAGEECEPWTDEECIQFISEVDAHVTPLVAYQQSLEKMIRDCTTVADINAITIDYSSVLEAGDTHAAE